ncbi:MAG: competence protein CoiA family protein [Bacteroidota bacterium]
MKAATPKLTIARQGQRWVSIRSVPSGLACNCRCPACGAALIAKKGRRQQHHFAHAHGVECVGGWETALHRFAKHVILSERQVWLPPVEVFKVGTVRPAQLLRATKAEAEVTRGNLRLDVLLSGPNVELVVEIRVSHAVEARKRRRLTQLGLPAIEIDMGRIYQVLGANGQADDIVALRRAILRELNARQWLFSPLQHRWEYRLRKAAVQRKVHISQQGTYWHYHVYACPRNLRAIRSGYRAGESYARVFQDCLHCQRCREITYEKEWVGFREIPLRPASVWCASD